MTSPLSPKPFAAYSPAEFKAYVTSLYVEPLKAAPPADFSFRLNAKGNPVLTVRRQPKWLTSEEVAHVAGEISWPLQRLWLHILKGKKIEIRIPCSKDPKEKK